MKNERGVVVLAVVFIGLFALLAGAVGGTIFGAKAALKGTPVQLIDPKTWPDGSK